MSERPDDSLAATLLEAIADHRGLAIDDLDFVLQHVVDVDALNALARHDGAAWSFSFTLDGHTVTVDSDGLILIDGEPATPA